MNSIVGFLKEESCANFTKERFKICLFIVYNTVLCACNVNVYSYIRICKKNYRNIEIILLFITTKKLIQLFINVSVNKRRRKSVALT